MKLLASVLCLALLGCADMDSPEVVALNKASLSGNGKYVGTLPDGRAVRMYEIDRGDNPTHYLYVAGDDVTINRTEGKTRPTEVVIDGLKYIPQVEQDSPKSK